MIYYKLLSQKRFYFSLVIFKESLTLEQLSAKIECGSPSVVLARWVRPAIEHAQDVRLFGEARSGLYCYGLFVQSLFICSIFCLILNTCFSLFCFGCVLFSKIEYFGLGFCFDFFVFYFVFKKT